MRRLRFLAVIGVVLLGVVLASAVVYANKPDDTGKHDHPNDFPDDSEGFAIETTNFEFTPRDFRSDGTQTEVEVRLVQGNWHNVSLRPLGTVYENGVCMDAGGPVAPLFDLNFENKRPIIVDISELKDEKTLYYFCRFHLSRDMVGTITRAPQP